VRAQEGPGRGRTRPFPAAYRMSVFVPTTTTTFSYSTTKVIPGHIVVLAAITDTRIDTSTPTVGACSCWTRQGTLRETRRPGGRNEIAWEINQAGVARLHAQAESHSEQYVRYGKWHHYPIT
jgi:hypothetical protein